MDNKIEVQHNMFLVIYPEEYYEYFGIEPILIRKVDIGKVYKINEREDSNERNPLYGIVIKMKNDEEHVEWYEDYRPELIEAGYIAEKIRDERFKNILIQLSEDNDSSICKDNKEEI